MNNNFYARRRPECPGSVRAAVMFSFLIVGLPTAVRAQNADEVRKFEQALLRMQAQFEKAQAEQRHEIDELKNQLQELRAGAASPHPPVEAARNVQPSGTATAARAGASYMNVSFGSVMDGGWSTAAKPSERLELGDHDPQKRGFSLRNAELALDGAVDPFFKGFANIVLKLDENDETEIELEESYLKSTALPANLQLKAGQFFAAFGRQNPQHPHQWAFVDQPLVLGRAFGPDGLRNIGTQLSWLAPTPFYSELFLGVFDSQGGTAFNFRNPGEEDDSGRSTFHGREVSVNELRGSGDLLFTPRASASFDLSDTQTLVTGVSGAFGPNSTGTGNRTEIYGVDAYWKWKPESATAGFPFVAVQSEAVYSRYEAGADPDAALPDEVLRDYGGYAQFIWGFEPQWVVSLRADYVNGNNSAFDEFDPLRGERFRLSPVLTFYPSEFSKVRLQYNFDEGRHFRDASSVWMQLEFDLGAHAAHAF